MTAPRAEAADRAALGDALRVVIHRCLHDHNWHPERAQALCRALGPLIEALLDEHDAYAEMRMYRGPDLDASRARTSKTEQALAALRAAGAGK